MLALLHSLAIILIRRVFYLLCCPFLLKSCIVSACFGLGNWAFWRLVPLLILCWGNNTVKPFSFNSLLGVFLLFWDSLWGSLSQTLRNETFCLIWVYFKLLRYVFLFLSNSWWSVSRNLLYLALAWTSFFIFLLLLWSTHTFDVRLEVRNFSSLWLMSLRLLDSNVANTLYFWIEESKRRDGGNVDSIHLGINTVLKFIFVGVKRRGHVFQEHRVWLSWVTQSIWIEHLRPEERFVLARNRVISAIGSPKYIFSGRLMGLDVISEVKWNSVCSECLSFMVLNKRVI